MAVITAITSLFIFSKRKGNQTSADELNDTGISKDLIEKVDKQVEEKFSDRNITALVDLMNKQLRKKDD